VLQAILSGRKKQTEDQTHAEAPDERGKEQQGTKHPASDDSDGRKDEYLSYTISYTI
jgi:hypothetical protein